MVLSEEEVNTATSILWYIFDILHSMYGYICPADATCLADVVDDIYSSTSSTSDKLLVGLMFTCGAYAGSRRNLYQIYVGMKPLVRRSHH